jgi:anti-sigma B factor antagonist
LIPLSQFSITQRSTSTGGVCLSISGEMDLATAPRVTEAVRRAIAEHADVLVDLSRLRFIDCAGLRAILSAQADSEREGCGFSVIPGDEPVQRVFRLTKADRLVRFVQPNDELAL